MYLLRPSALQKIIFDTCTVLFIIAPLLSTAPAHLLRNIEPLLEQPIPASYIKLQDIVRSLAHQCKAEHKIPIFNKEAYRYIYVNRPTCRRLAFYRC